jgi:hypothetical protein
VTSLHRLSDYFMGAFLTASANPDHVRIAGMGMTAEGKGATHANSIADRFLRAFMCGTVIAGVHAGQS